MTLGASVGALTAENKPLTVDSMNSGRASTRNAHTGFLAPTPPCYPTEIGGINAPEGTQAPTEAHSFGVFLGGSAGIRGGIAMLTDLQIKKAAAKDKPYKLADDRGLYCYVSTTGAKSFRLKYRYGGKEKTLTIGRWPDVSLSRSRELAQEARSELARGRDPGTVKRQARAAGIANNDATLEAITLEWHGKQVKRWAARQHATFIASLRNEIFPALGKLPIAEITAPMILAELSRIEKRGAVETAHRIRRRLETVFTYALGTGRASSNPAAMLARTLTPLSRSGKQPAALTLAEARAVFAAVHQYPADPETLGVSRLLALTAVRPGDARGMAWVELEGLGGPAPLWRIPAARLKGTKAQKSDKAREHLVPLSPQAVAVIESMKPYSAHLPLVFPSPRFPKRPLSDTALSMLYQRAGFIGRHVPHGWRASFSTIMNERHPEEAAAIDATLAHVKGGVEGRYNRASHIARRRELLAEWARILTEGTEA
jgi:integrase